jgi:hypothetical protein
MSFTVYTKVGAEVINPSYFKRLSCKKPGTQHVMLGRALPVLTADYSFLIVKLAHRTERTIINRNGRNGMQVQTYYATASTSYVVATINWDSGFIEELAAHPTRAAAEQDMRARHQATK